MMSGHAARRRHWRRVASAAAAVMVLVVDATAPADGGVGYEALPPGFVALDPNDYASLLHMDDNVSQLDWAVQSVPFFDIDDADLREAYYFRWLTYRQHIFEYPDVGHVVTEFLPDVPWAGKCVESSSAAVWTVGRA
jgi:hypothetical protein